MKRFAWGVFWAVVQLSPIVAFANTGVEKFGCDNNRIFVAVEPRRTAIAIVHGFGKGDYLFTSQGAATVNQTWVVGSSRDFAFRVSIRKDHWGRVQVSRRDGRLVADELVFCNNP